MGQIEQYKFQGHQRSRSRGCQICEIDDFKTFSPPSISEISQMLLVKVIQGQGQGHNETQRSHCSIVGEIEVDETNRTI